METMRVDTACDLVNNGLALPPNWEVKAEDFTRRYEDTIKLTVVITDAHSSDRDKAPEYAEIVPGGTVAHFVVPVGDCGDIEDLVYRVILALIENITHEFREFVRVKPTNWAPFHPHKIDGIKRWSSRHGVDPYRDYLFGASS